MSDERLGDDGLTRCDGFVRCDGFLRRDLMRVGGLTALGLGLGDFLRLQRLAAAESDGMPAPKAKACILIWLDGGPSHLETFDPKPNAPSEVRGPMSTIATSLPGVRFNECLPQTAAMLDRVAIIRSMTSPLGEHNFGTHYMMTGYKPTPVLEYPTYGPCCPMYVRATIARATIARVTVCCPPMSLCPRLRWAVRRSRGAVTCPRVISRFRSGAIRARRIFKFEISISIKVST